MIERLKLLIGSGLGSGWVRPAPGTWGSFAALLLVHLSFGNLYAITGLLLVCILLNYWAYPTYEAHFGEDPGSFVMDEWAGMMVTFFIIVPTNSLSLMEYIIILVSGFILFRFFDILKPLGIDPLQNLPGGHGVLFDDLLAGLYATIILNSLIFVVL